MKTIKMFVVAVALLAVFAAPVWAQPQEENQDVPPPCWDYWSCGGRYPTCAELYAAGIYCGVCEECIDPAWDGMPYCQADPFDWCDDGGEIINYIEPDPRDGDPAFLRRLGVAVPVPTCVATG